MRKIILRLAETEYILLILFGLFIAVSRMFNFAPCKIIQDNFWMFFIKMVTFLPCMFIVIGLFDVWLPKEKVEKHIGANSGVVRGAVWCIFLGIFQAGPLHGAFPVAHLLWSKGCSIKNIFIYLSTSSTFKLTALTFEIAFLGLKFSLLRVFISLPVIILIGCLMEIYLKDKNFEVKATARRTLLSLPKKAGF